MCMMIFATFVELVEVIHDENLAVWHWHRTKSLPCNVQPLHVHIYSLSSCSVNSSSHRHHGVGRCWLNCWYQYLNYYICLVANFLPEHLDHFATAYSHFLSLAFRVLFSLSCDVPAMQYMKIMLEIPGATFWVGRTVPQTSSSGSVSAEHVPWKTLWIANSNFTVP